jgi:hypothetical protein
VSAVRTRTAVHPHQRKQSSQPVAATAKFALRAPSTGLVSFGSFATDAVKTTAQLTSAVRPGHGRGIQRKAHPLSAKGNSRSTDPRTKDQAVASAATNTSYLKSMARISRARQCATPGFQLGVTRCQMSPASHSPRRLRTTALVCQRLTGALSTITQTSACQSSSASPPKDRWGFVQVALCLRYVALDRHLPNLDRRKPRYRLYLWPANFIPKIAPDTSAFLVLCVVVSNQTETVNDRKTSDQTSD